MSTFLYISMIFLWGFSWIAIKWQQGFVPMEQSIFYRFSIAAIIMIVIGMIWQKLEPVKMKDQPFIALQGLCLFCCNFLAFYSATLYIPSGLVAIIMATAPIFNALHSLLFYQREIQIDFWVSVLLGLTGIVFLFANDLLTTDWSLPFLYGLCFALLGTWFFSLGNMLSIRNTQNNISPYTATTYGMIYGCIAMFFIIIIQDHPFEFTLSTKYISSLLYLAIPASVIGFTLYLILVDRLGASNASYILVLTPVVALSVSALFEDYDWTIYSTFGLVLVVLGNTVTQSKYWYNRVEKSLKKKKNFSTRSE